MKEVIFFLMLIYAFPCNLFGQTTWTVGIGDIYDFSTLQTAHDGAAPNDIILLQQGGNYGSATFTKSLIIKGPGYYLNENNITDANQLSAGIGNIVFNEGSQGSFISGIDGANTITINIDNIVIDRCDIYNMGMNGISNIIVRNCLIERNISSNALNTQVLFQNCVFEYDSNCSSTGCYVFYQASNWSNCEFSNNIFVDPSYSGVTTSTSAISFNYCTFKNNIFLNDYVSGGSESTNIVENNVFVTTHSSIPTPSNITGADAASIFVGYPEQGTNSPDARWQLAPNSPAIGAGEDGTDCGIFGGDHPYVLSGIPALPIIYELNVPQDASPEGLNVNLKAKTNN